MLSTSATIREALSRMTEEDILAINQAALAREYHVSRERIRQLIAERGIAVRNIRRTARLEERILRLRKLQKHPPTLVTDDQRALLKTIETDWKRKVPVQKIAEKLGRTTQGLYATVYRLRLRFPGALPSRRTYEERPFPLSKEDRIRVREWLRQSLGFPEIARRLGKSATWVENLVLRLHQRNPERYPFPAAYRLVYQEAHATQQLQEIEKKIERASKRARARAEALHALLVDMRGSPLSRIARTIQRKPRSLQTRVRILRKRYPDLFQGIEFPQGRPRKTA